MAGALLLVPSAVLAHAELVGSIPADGATLEGPPPVVELRFSEALTSKSSIELVGPTGSIASGTPAADDPLTMRMVPPTLGPGGYSVRWTAATDDGHIERGSIDFTVVAPPPTPSPSPAPSAATEPTPSPTATAAPASPAPTPGPTEPVGGDGPDLTVLLAVAVVAILLGFGTRALIRGSSRP